MKKLKRLTRAQKALLAANGYDPADWLAERDLPNSTTFCHRRTGTFLVLEKNL